MTHDQSTVRSTPKDVFFHLLATIMLYISVYAVITLLFSCINILFPDALSFYYAGELDTIRLSTAILIVGFPVYMVMMMLIHRDIAAQPQKNDIGARKWLTYLTIFLAAIMIITDLITLLYNFLNGELSVRFLLKILVVLIIGAAVFGYYLWDIRKDGRPDKGLASLSAFGAWGAAIAAVIVSFLVAGSPWYQRSVRFDEQRITDLQIIQGQIIQHWTQKNALPANLDALTDSISGFKAPDDPETGSAYEYAIKEKLAFQLCATFKNKSIPDSMNNGRPVPVYPNDPYSQNWSHDIGRVCFERTIDPEIYRQNPPVKY
ncbi:hypothetical protein HZA87_03015 [Candidatus Uhrbacteria bacterium]|nr:hypothetical protein [Candidatus Uhrbacteria bacterium]